jgi:hypothetical protein
MADRELKLQEREEQDNLRLDPELEALASCESKLNSHEASVEVERKSLVETHVEVLGHCNTSCYEEPNPHPNPVNYVLL